MKTLTVEKLIKLLEKENLKAQVVLEGCDCAENCVGISNGEGAYKNQIILRRVNGVFESDDLEIF